LAAPAKSLGAWRALGLALALGAGGGFVFSRLHLPLAWMLGAMCATTVTALAGAPVRVPPGLRLAMIGVLGVMLGSAFRPEVFAHAGRWTVSLSSLFVFVFLVAVVVGLYFRRVAGYDRTTAFFSAIPGGLSEMIVVGGTLGGDDRSIALTHASRILLVVLVVPFWFRLVEGYVPGMRPPGPAFATLPWDELGLLAGSGVVGFLVARGVRLPSPALIGPMALSALIHLTGLSAARPPAEAVIVAQVVIGAAIGCRFAGVALARVARAMLAATGSTALMLGLCVTVAALLHAATGLPGDALVLAFAPGGLAEMSLIALALGIDPAFVSLHHIVRIFIVIIVAPTAYRLVYRRTGADD